MLRLLTDEDFDGDITRGLLRQNPGLDLVRVLDIGLGGSPDLVVLEWASRESRIVFDEPWTMDHGKPSMVHRLWSARNALR